MPEMKNQGHEETHKINQAKGNAIERLAKNINFIRLWTKDESILPFIGFCAGYDFCTGCSYCHGSYIIDRLASMNDFYPLNQVRLFKNTYGQGGQSNFYQVNNFQEKFMYDMCLDVAEKSFIYYRNKYKI